MNKSESIKELAAALAAAQAEMPPADLNAMNPFLKNRFADLGSIISTAKPVIAKHGLSVSQLPVTEDGRIGVVTILMHSSGEWLESAITLPLGDEKGKSPAQVAGSIITYLRRYSIAAILGMYAEEDSDGGDESSSSKTTRQQTKPVPKKEPSPKPVKQQEIPPAPARKQGPLKPEDPPVETPTERWQRFLREAEVTEEKALAALGTKSVSEWIRLGRGRNLEGAIIEIKELMGLK